MKNQNLTLFPMRYGFFKNAIYYKGNWPKNVKFFKKFYFRNVRTTHIFNSITLFSWFLFMCIWQAYLSSEFDFMDV